MILAGHAATTNFDHKAARGVRIQPAASTAIGVSVHQSTEGADSAGGVRSRRLTLVPSPPPARRGAGDTTPGDLVRAAARGEALGWSGLVRRFGGLVRGIASSHGLNDADTADVSQMVWISLARHLDQLRDPDRVASWLATTTRHECVRMLRQHRPTPTSETQVLDRVEEDDADAELARRERAELLRGVIRTLPQQQRRLLEMLLRDPQPSYKEISDTLEISIGSIGPTRQRCLAVLRRKCTSAGIEPFSA